MEDHHSIKWEETITVDKEKHPGELPLEEAKMLVLVDVATSNRLPLPGPCGTSQM